MLKIQIKWNSVRVASLPRKSAAFSLFNLLLKLFLYCDMMRSALRAVPLPETSSMRRRHVFTLVALGFTVVLLGWGAVVTSIEAGLAVPDWPTTFDSIDPINPTPDWYKIPPVLAEHGHRLMGMIVGALTLLLAFWTFFADPRPWMKRIGLFALLLVILQGVLGGLRVVWISLDLAVVHACTAQLFFATLVSMAFFTSGSWLRAEGVLIEGEAATRFRRLSVLTAVLLYGQIILGALLRHRGDGVDPMLAGIHMLGAAVVFAMVFMTIKAARQADPEKTLVSKLSHGLAGILTLQIILGFAAYFIILKDIDSMRTTLQVVLNTTHMVVGALFFATTIGLVLLAARKAVPKEETA
ncbi:MAG: COX15/CtaA family protein [Bacteroidota bacterium]